MPQKNQLVTLEITDITEEGNGVGKLDGFTLFVPGTAVGDKISARVVKVQKSFGYAIVEELLCPGPGRIEPDCPVYRPCGGCCLRHITYDAELSLKQNWVEQHLRRIGGVKAPVLPILSSPQQVGYRNKAQYPVRRGVRGVELGMFGKRSHRVVPCLDCKLQPPHFSGILQIIHDFCEEHQVSIYNEENHVGLLRHVYLRYAQATEETMVCLVVNGPALPRSEELAARLAGAGLGVASVIINENTARTNVILGRSCKTIWGKDAITDELCGLRFSLSPLSFYQVNREGAQRLYGVVAELAGLTGRELLLDLYCGTGTIGLSMAASVQELIGVEVVPSAVEDARKNAEENGIQNARFFCADAAEAALRLRAEGLRPDVVVLDPPRKGCGEAVLQTVAEMGPHRLVMVSCNSATLARDLAFLHTLGYGTVKVQPVDMFPRTGHVECVALLERDGEHADATRGLPC